MQVTRHKYIAAYNKYDHPSDKQQCALATKRRATQLGQGEGSPPPAKQLAVRTPFKTSRPTFRCPALLLIRAFLSSRLPRPSFPGKRTPFRIRASPALSSASKPSRLSWRPRCAAQ
jgi:hypothetical protein